MNRITAAVVLAALTTGSLAAGDTRQVVRMPEPVVRHLLDTMGSPLAALIAIQRAPERDDMQRAPDRVEKRLALSSLDAHGASHAMPPRIECTEPPGRAR